MMKMTKTNGSANMIRRCIGSALKAVTALAASWVAT